MKKKYPDVDNAKGIPLTGLSNARPETLAIEETVKRNIKAMPFSVKDYIEMDMPWNESEGDWGQ